MKKICLLLTIFFPAICAIAQSVGINNTTPHGSAILDVKSNTKGMLMPRTSTTSRLAITNPAIGLILYDTTASAFYFYNGSSWAMLTERANVWSLAGNTNTNPSINFVGTTDNQPLRFRINNINAGLIDSILSNTSIGFRTLDSVTTGFSNTAIGYKALVSNVNGNSNTASGFNALRFNKSGSGNTANGGYALYLNTNGNINTANGFAALYSNTTGSNNSASGYYALYNNSIGNFNSASGVSALQTNITGSNNTASGAKSLFSNTSGSFNTADGANALGTNTTGSNNTAIGETALFSNTSGAQNTASGFQSLFANNIGEGNTGNGYKTLFSNSTGIRNTGIGFRTLYSNSTGQSNTAMGELTMADNTIGEFNTAIGSFALSSNLTGNQNTAVGESALQHLKNGTKNIAIGSNSGNAIGSPNVTNTISIGNDDILNGANNQVIMGNFSSTGYYSNNPWATFSDARIKTNIKEDVQGLNFIMRLKPVTYFKSIKQMVTITANKETADFSGKYDVEKIKFSGFLAQEVEQSAKETGYDFSGIHKPNNSNELYALSYETFVVPLVKAMQEQQVIIMNQQKQIDLLEKRLTALEVKL
jgi:trimeric autotransporter adhesin